ncbi:hypothetical protein [Bifidobacterium sp. SO1]|uniref:hypothetical protein n=1 Tax=Bifidobacterium sp. SO1 TaxID=2809029 RepID=UPI001F0A4893|nr:hypothetical protein [Bifidobacterium sp. SO1]
MNGYWLGALTPFAIAFGVLLLWLASNLFGAIISWAWKKAHYGLLKKAVVPVGWDKNARKPSIRRRRRSWRTH